MAAEAYPLTWPDGWPRTPFNNRRHNNSWKGSSQKYREHMLEQLAKMGVEKVVISTNKPLRLDGHFRIDTAEPSDGGVAIYFDYKKKPMCLACDKYYTVQDNLHAIGLTLEAIRSIERNGASDLMERAFRGFTALPEKAGEYWREVLQIPADQKVTKDDIETAFKRLAHVAHPDKGGSVEQWHLLNNARANALRDIGAAR